MAPTYLYFGKQNYVDQELELFNHWFEN